jgi:hypothetical protein
MKNISKRRMNQVKKVYKSLIDLGLKVNEPIFKDGDSDGSEISEFSFYIPSRRVRFGVMKCYEDIDNTLEYYFMDDFVSYKDVEKGLSLSFVLNNM